VVAALLAGALPDAHAGQPSSDVKRLLFPAEAALAADDLALAEKEAAKAIAADPNVTAAHLIVAEAAWRGGQLSKAKAAYEKALQLGDANADAHAGLALVALAQDDLESAATHAAAAVAADKGSWMASFAQGRVLVEQGKPDQAFAVLEKGKKLKGRADRRDLFESAMGLVALAENDAAGAETAFIKARALSPNTVEHTMNLAAMYETTNQWSQAANVLEAAEQKVGSSPQLSFRLGRAREHQEQWNDALRQYQKALAADSTYVPALTALGSLYLLDKSKTALAVETLSRAVALQPTPKARIGLGRALMRSGKAAEAVPHLEAAAQSDPSIETKLELARAYVAADQIDKAEPLFADVDVAIEAKGEDFLGLANSYAKLKKYDEARAAANKALEKDPQLSEAYYRLGVIDLLTKSYDAAIVNFNKKLEIDPKSAATHMNLGVAYQSLGKREEALNAYREATRQAPNAAQPWAQLGMALSSTPSATPAVLAEAQAAYQKALSLDPQNAAAKRGMGFTYLVQEKYPQAISHLKEATQGDADDPNGWVWLGQALLNSGSHAEARSAFQRALKLDPGNRDAQECLSLLSGASK
jgi:tetratricopeptide (TPR) repeat protein